MKDLIVGTAGHIDHGKSTLLRALTGIDPDRLKEEKQRGITIDIGFAHLELSGLRIGFIDVPGHEKFVKNMLAGIGGIHLVLLVVAADESVMPQTVEHFQICKLLGIRHGIVVLTKKNSIEPELLPLIEEEVRELARGSFLENAPLVAVDSISGEGLEELKQVLVEQIGRLRSDRGEWVRSRLFRMPIDRVFSIRGFGTVVTGTPYAGKIDRDQTVEAQPSRRTAKIRGIEIFNQKSEAAAAGQRAALNLSGLDKEQLERGMFLAAPGQFEPGGVLDALVSLLPQETPPLRHRSPIRFHLGSGEFIGRIYLLEKSSLSPGETALVQIRLASLTLACPGDRFVLRSYSPVATIGGGFVLDNHPSRHRKRDLAPVLQRMQRLSLSVEAEPEKWEAELIRYLVESAGPSGIDLAELRARTGFTSDCLLQHLRRISGLVLIPQEPPLAVWAEVLERLKNAMVSYLEAFLSRNPLAGGIPKEELKRRFVRRRGPGLFQFVLENLQEERRIQLDASTVTLYGRRLTLTEQQESIRRNILDALESSPFAPPSLDELSQQPSLGGDDLRRVYFYLLQTGELVRISGDIVIPANQLDHLKAQLAERFTAGQSFSVAEFKDTFNISRKYAIPFLEYLDRERITRRLGDKRVLV